MEEKNRVTDLIQSALEEEDFENRINFLVAGMMCEECNDSVEKMKKNQGWLNEIVEFCKNYTGNKKKYLDHIKENIESFLAALEKEIKMLGDK